MPPLKNIVKDTLQFLPVRNSFQEGCSRSFIKSAREVPITWRAGHKPDNTLINIESPSFYDFYAADDITIQLSACFCSEPSCHFLAAFADPQVFLTHVVAVMDIKIFQIQQMVLFIFFQAVQKRFFFFLGYTAFRICVLLLPLLNQLIVPLLIQFCF